MRGGGFGERKLVVVLFEILRRRRGLGEAGVGRHAVDKLRWFRVGSRWTRGGAENDKLRIKRVMPESSVDQQ